MKTPTLSDVARRAGVSYATVDRHVNGRAGVGARSAALIRQAIADLGYVRNVAAANLSQGRIYRFVFILPEGQNSFFAHMRGILAEEAARRRAERIEISVVDVPAFDGPALAGAIRALVVDPPDGVAMVGAEGPEPAAALVALHAAGAGVVALVGDLPRELRHAYVGIDNLAAGGAAARLMGMAHGGNPGRVLPVAGSLLAPDHAARLAGFSAVLARDYPGVTALPAIEGRDRGDLVGARVAAALAAGGITGVYSMGAGNRGLAQALAPLGAGRPIAIVHELVSHSAAALREGLFDVVIDQRPAEEVALALRILRAHADRRDPPAPAPISPAVILRDLLP